MTPPLLLVVLYYGESNWLTKLQLVTFKQQNAENPSNTPDPAYTKRDAREKMSYFLWSRNDNATFNGITPVEWG